ncbi:MAG TPA: class I SAM-dependent methyltransferase [Solirubrobacterales bacterium]
MTGQDANSAEQNAEFFVRDKHGRDVAELDTYRNIRVAVTEELAGTELLLDVGNGGVFDYDTDRVGEIVAVDLFLDQLPDSRFPPNVTPRRGDALNLDEPDGTYDVVLEALLYHHLVGRRPRDSIENVRRALAEAERVLRPGGRLVVAESCVPRWFYGVERLMFRPLVLLARTPVLGGHPAVLQLPFPLLRELVAERLEIERAYFVPMGKWVTQFGRRWPAALTPARAVIVVARKRSGP